MKTIIDCNDLKPNIIVEGNKVTVTCGSDTIPAPTPVPTPVPTPTPVPNPTPIPPSTGKVWMANPSTFAGLISAGSQVKAGETIRLEKGIYVPPPRKDLPINQFKVEIAGIVIEGTEGAMIDGATAFYGAINIAADSVMVKNLEIGNSNTNRLKDRGNGIEVSGKNVVLDGLYVHDCGSGIFGGQSALSLKIINCLVLNNGWQNVAPDRAHGHGIYCQNDTSIKEIKNNIVGFNWGAGIHLFGQSAEVNNFWIESNIVFLNGKTNERNILIGGQNPSDNINLIKNYTYYPLDSIAPDTFIGYREGNRTAIVDGNYFVGGTGVYLLGWNSLIFKNNTLVEKERSLTYQSSVWQQFENNNYFSSTSTPFASQGAIGGGTYSFASWKAKTGEIGSSMTLGKPTETKTFTFPKNDHTVYVIYNWGGSAHYLLKGISNIYDVTSGEKYSSSTLILNSVFKVFIVK